MLYSVGQLQQILRQAGWPDETVSTNAGPMSLIVAMAAIGMAESSGNSSARNLRGEYSLGLWQINMDPKLGRSYDRDRLLSDPVYNASVALQIYRQQGMRAWGAYTDGRWRQSKYLADSQAAYGGGTSSPVYTDGTFALDGADTGEGFSGSALLLAASAVVALIVILDL